MQSKYPDSIMYPGTFDRMIPLGFDGIFDWSWTAGCFGDTNIGLTDLDAIVERNGHFLVFETKNPGRHVPLGQSILLRRLAATGFVTVIIIWGKTEPEDFIVIYPFGRRSEKYYGKEQAIKIVSAWFNWADKK